MEEIRYITRGSNGRSLTDGELLVQIAERVSEIVQWINKRESKVRRKK